jgi:hypothetical protein
MREEVVVFYMPHCERFLYEEVCVLREKQEGRWLVVGNSLREYAERCGLLGQPVPAMFPAQLPVEGRLADYGEALNDTFAYLL